MDQVTLLITAIVFLVFLILAIYYSQFKKAFDQALLLVIFGLIFVLASVSNLLEVILPILFLLFFVSIFSQYLRKKHGHQLIWSISLFMFFLTTLFQAIASITGTWSLVMLRVYYVFAAFQVMLLGLGELYLLSKRYVITKNTNIAVIFISGFFWMLFGFIYFSKSNESVLLAIALFGILILLYGIIDLLFAILKLDRFQVSGLQFTYFLIASSMVMFIFSVFYTFTVQPLVGYNLNHTQAEAVISSVWSEYSVIRAFSPLFAVNGAMFIFVGSIYSYLLWQYSIYKKEGKFSFSTGIFNIYFALGVAIFSAGGALSQNSVITVLYITELLGGFFMYFGFLESDKISMDMIMDIVTFRFLHKNYQQSKTTGQ